MALSDNLVAFWKLGEVSGTRVDSIGSNDLGDNASVTQADGKIGNAAQFTRANSEFLDIADNTDMSTGDIDFNIGAWIWIDAKPTGGGKFLAIANKYKSSTNQREWALEWEEDTDRINFSVSPDGSTSGSSALIAADSFGSPPIGEWIFVLAWHDAVNDTINIQINNGPVDSLAHTLGVFDGTQAFQIGSINSLGYFDGRIDAVGWWKGALTQLERTQAYNDGSGFEPPFPNPSTFTEPVTVVTHSCGTFTGMVK
ncbi:hypothetical protein LCGC14_2837610 [marine sediment metagenome]|uniref:LamG-like jellyroll fold domain-containing protein n=1 Tax=marine sediment metagenome TaxID=412755 RepID=A0A0F9AKM7_9ZZZZ